MKKKISLAFGAALILVFTLVTGTQIATPVLGQKIFTDGEIAFEDWKVKNNGGYYSEDNGVLRMWSDAHDEGIKFFKMIDPENDFEFSLQVRANQMDGFGIFVGSKTLLDGFSKEGVQFEFHNKYGVTTFLLARYVHTLVWETGKYGDIWDWQGFAYGQENVWYTMKLSVQANPFKVSGEVFDEKGNLIGTYSVLDMINLKFEDIESISFGCPWGGDYSVRNISDVTSISNDGNPSEIATSKISIEPEVTATTLGTPINIKGKLIDSNGQALTNENVVLSYSFQGIDGWIPISSTYTNAAGEYMIQWANAATGYFALRIQWIENQAYLECQNSTTVNILPYEQNKVFFVQSNSTITALTFNSTAAKLTFSVTGPSGTNGYTQVFLDKSLISNPEEFGVFLDQTHVEYSIISLGDSWLITIYYSHSTHEIIMQFQNQAEYSMNNDAAFWIGLTVAGLAAILALVTIKLKQHFPKQ
jgi:hypothetical protein